MTPDLVGGHVALDLVNTVSWRLDVIRRVDRLHDAAALAEWLRRVRLLDGAEASRLLPSPGKPGAPITRALSDILALREDLHTLLTPVVDHDARIDSLVVPRRTQRLIADAVAHARLCGFPMRWQLELRHARDLPRLLALQALELLASPDLELVRRCAGSGCGWLFLDRSRSHTRRWCSSTDCGNRDRVRRHYVRHRGTQAGTGAAPKQGGNPKAETWRSHLASQPA